MVEMDRREPVSTKPGIGPAEKRDWIAKGWAHLHGFLGPSELSVLRHEADRLWADEGLFGIRGSVPNSAMRLDRLDPVSDVSTPFAALSGDHRLLTAVNDLLGGEAQLMKDKFIVKPPGASGYAAHQDAAYWPGLALDYGRFLTAAIFLDDATAETGAIECVPGQHHALLTAADTIADLNEAELGSFITIEAKAGDLLLFHALTPHRSAQNRSSGMRRVLFYTYGIDPRPNLRARYRQLQEKGRS
jgi:ectoine hydroxylase-related dioxygenase (phytanoyl-CoA dioxygenase family)